MDWRQLFVLIDEESFSFPAAEKKKLWLQTKEADLCRKMKAAHIKQPNDTGYVVKAC